MAVFSKLARPGKDALMLLRGDRVVVRWDGGEARGTVTNCGGFLGDEGDADGAALDESLVFLALGAASKRGHEWILVETASWPTGSLLDGACQLVVDEPRGEETFGPMTLAGWLARPGMGARGLLVLARAG